MNDEQQEPHVFRLLQGEALDIHHSPTGRVGRVFRGEGLEAVWVAKQQEVIDSAWFSQPTVDLLALPPNTRCRAYRWPRDRQEATIFLAVYPVRDD